MQNYSKLTKSLTVLIKTKSDPSKAKQIESYLKDLVKSYGLSSPTVKQVYKEFKNENDQQLSSLSLDEKFQFSKQLLGNDYIEQKAIGINLMQDMSKKLDISHINSIKDSFYAGHVNNWATCDSICGSVLRPWSAVKKENAVEIANWSKDQSNLWVRRASCVTFITHVRLKDDKNFTGFTNLMFEVCENNIIHQERFNQLGTGWLLRELSVVDKKRFLEFFYKYHSHFIREGLRYAVEKLPDKERKNLMNYKPFQNEEEELTKKKKK